MPGELPRVRTAGPYLCPDFRTGLGWFELPLACTVAVPQIGPLCVAVTALGPGHDEAGPVVGGELGFRLSTYTEMKTGITVAPLTESAKQFRVTSEDLSSLVSVKVAKPKLGLPQQCRRIALGRRGETFVEPDHQERGSAVIDGPQRGYDRALPAARKAVAIESPSSMCPAMFGIALWHAETTVRRGSNDNTDPSSAPLSAPSLR